MEPTPEQLKALWKAVDDWIHWHSVHCGEDIFQVDSVNEALPELAETVCDIVGYKKLEE